MKTKTQPKKAVEEHHYKKEEIRQIVEKKKEEIKTTPIVTPEILKKRKRMFRMIWSVLSAFVLAIIIYIFTFSLLTSIITFLAASIGIIAYLFFKEKYDATLRIRKIEEVFPDFIELMASNLRAGMTIDKALLVSSRKEFAPLDEEILRLGKDIMTGKEITLALYEMGERIKSEKIKKTISLITTGIVSGGNLSILLEETAINMRERSFVEKRASSNVLMYVIFVFFAVAVGAPILFGLSSVLIKTVTDVMSSVPTIDPSYSSRLPFTISKISISTTFVNYFAVIYLVITAILSSLVIGVVNKGEEKSGINYMLPLAIISITIFFLVQIILLKFVLGLFAG